MLSSIALAMPKSCSPRKNTWTTTRRCHSSLSHVFTFFSRTVYNLSTLKHDTVQQQLYQKYTESINVYLQQNILPELQKLHNDDLLEALGRKWANHEVMVRWMQRFFQYLDRFYVEINSLTPLTD